MSKKKERFLGDLKLTDKEFLFLERQVRKAILENIFKRDAKLLNDIEGALSGRFGSSGLSSSHWVCLIRVMTLSYRYYLQFLEVDRKNDVHIRSQAGLCLSVMFKLEHLISLRSDRQARQVSLFEVNAQQKREVSHA